MLHIFVAIMAKYTAWKVSVFGVFLVRIFPHSDQKNFEYGYFSRSDGVMLVSECTEIWSNIQDKLQNFKNFKTFFTGIYSTPRNNQNKNKLHWHSVGNDNH